MRKIVHVDMDAFYAAVEQRDRPELRGRPVIVGGEPRGRGVVCTASYEARRFGVHSAMPSAQAYRLCPQGVFLKPDFARYERVSRQIREVFEEVTDLVEPLSLDEAYLDVSDNRWAEPSATRVAARIRAEIKARTGLTASAGVAPNKFLAKVASDFDKPDGLTVIPPDQVSGFVARLPVRKIPGVGRVTEEKLRARGIETCADVLSFDERKLAGWLGSFGPHLRRLAEGQDERPVVAARERKSVSVEDTFPQDLLTVAEAKDQLERLAEVLAGRLIRHGRGGRTVVLKVKYASFEQVTRSKTLPLVVAEQAALLATALELISQTEIGKRPVRLLGLGVGNLHDPAQAPAQRVFPFFEAMLRGGL